MLNQAGRFGVLLFVFKRFPFRKFCKKCKGNANKYKYDVWKI